MREFSLKLLDYVPSRGRFLRSLGGQFCRSKCGQKLSSNFLNAFSCVDSCFIIAFILLIWCHIEFWGFLDYCFKLWMVLFVSLEGFDNLVQVNSELWLSLVNHAWMSWFQFFKNLPGQSCFWRPLLSGLSFGKCNLNSSPNFHKFIWNFSLKIFLEMRNFSLQLFNSIPTNFCGITIFFLW